MSNYWQRRETLHLAKLLKDEKKYEREINRIYRDMLDGAQKEIESFYGRYADKEGITITEARKRVSQLDIEAFERKAERYVRNKTFSKLANEEMRLYNATMRINRLEMLKANIGLELLKGGSELEEFMSEILQGRTIEELERQAGILGKTIRDNERLVHSIVNQSWQNADFSTRIWGHMGQMRGDIGKLLENGMIQGKNSRVLAKDLQQYYIGTPTLKNGKSGAKYAAERLMRTELARVQTEAQRQSFEKNGFSQYRFIVNAGCCDKCRAVASHNAGIYDLKDMMPGENAPPLHPFDRCSTAAYEDSNEYEAWLDYLDKGGTTISWNEYRKNGGPLELPTKNGKVETPKDGNDDFIPAKTIEEAENYIKQFVDDKQFGALGVSYKGVDVDVANEINKAISKVFKTFKVDKFGGIIAPAGNTKLGKMIDGAMAAFSPIRKSFLINRKTMKNMKTATKAFEGEAGTMKDMLMHPEKYDFSKLSKAVRGVVERGKVSGRATVPENIEQAIWHELGHMIEKQVYNSPGWDEVEANMPKYADKISGYAGVNKAEYVAESFAAYLKGENVVDPALVKIFESLKR